LDAPFTATPRDALLQQRIIVMAAGAFSVFTKRVLWQSSSLICII
jgi:hypothetical protein